MDMKKIPPIHQKRIITFVNHFIISTVSFLNKFINTCEQALIQLDHRMETLETTICMLETKLNSVPSLQQIQSTPFESTNVEVPAKSSVIQEDEVQENEENNESTSSPETIAPEIIKYHKMCQFGVPMDAVKLKMKQDGVDPSLLKH